MAAWTNGLDSRLRKLTGRLCSPAGLPAEERLSLEALRAILHSAQAEQLGRARRTKRRTVRARMTLSCSIDNERGAVGRGRTLDIGTGGIGALINRQIPAGARMFLTFPTPEGAKILAPVETMWSVRTGDGWRTGFRFTAELPEPTRNHITRMVLVAASEELLTRAVTHTVEDLRDTIPARSRRSEGTTPPS
jgi:PilZ domain-containing protein